MNAFQKTATVFGGTGFVGRQVVRELAKAGYTVKVATRVPERAFFLRPCGTVGQVVPFACAYGDPASIGHAIRGSAIVVNCIGILHERRKGDFKKIHADLPGAIAAACAYEGAQRFIHISGLGVEKGTSQYARTKMQGESNVRENFPGATILRPSIIFGPDDTFFNRFARLAQLAPVLPLIGGGHTKFQPVYVGDVADAVMAAIGNPATAGYIFELGGPEVVEFKELYEILLRHTGMRRMLAAIPFPLARAKACILGLFPNPVLTCDQVEALKTDSVAGGAYPGLPELGIVPMAMEAIIPHYLEQYRPGGRFGVQKRA